MKRTRMMTAALAALAVVAAGCGGGEDTAADAEATAEPTAVATTEPEATTEPPMATETPEPTEPAGPTESDDMADMDNAAEAFDFGEPAEEADADRTVAVETIEEGGFGYDPPEIDITPGETITFEVSNPGTAVHEFVIGGPATQQEHEEEMQQEGMEMHDDPNSVSVEPGETKTITWSFPETVEGQILFGCHVPGHYAAGMKGEFTTS